MRICSFLPAATEIICALGLEDSLCGVTYECDYPPSVRSKPVIVRPVVNTSEMSQRSINEFVSKRLRENLPLYEINTSLLNRIKPDVIILSNLCEVCSVTSNQLFGFISKLEGDPKIIHFSPKNLNEVIQGIIRIGEECGVGERAKGLAMKLMDRLTKIELITTKLHKRKVVCIEWFDPIYTSGHWIPEMVRIAGGYDILGKEGINSYAANWNDIVHLDPEIMILMPCGFDIRRAMRDIALLKELKGWNDISANKNGRIFVTNSSWYYSRPGPRLIDGLETMAKMIHPEVFGNNLPTEVAIKLSPLLRQFLKI